MRVFLTGATGFIGSALIPELINAGHQVLGLTRSDEGADALRAAGAEPHRGSLEDLESLRSGAAASEGVIHCGFDHDFSRFEANCEKDRRAIETMGNVLAGSDRLLIVTSGVGMGSLGPGRLAVESNLDREHPNPRTASEVAAEDMRQRGVNVAIVRLPQVHDTVKQGLITYLIALAREKGVSPYVGDGRNRWSAAHISDVARLYRLALEKNKSGVRYHAVAEEGLPVREIANVVGRGLKLPVTSIRPEEAPSHFGWMTPFASMDLAASSAQTRQQLDWHPTGPGLISDLERMDYAAS